MKQTSPKRAKELRQAAPVRAAYLEAHPWCELLELRLEELTVVLEWPVPDCRVRSEHPHEILSRARGGAIDDPENLKALCGPCHGWVHAHPAWSERHGFLRSALKAGTA